MDLYRTIKKMFPDSVTEFLPNSVMFMAKHGGTRLCVRKTGSIFTSKYSEATQKLKNIPQIVFSIQISYLELIIFPLFN